MKRVRPMVYLHMAAAVVFVAAALLGSLLDRKPTSFDSLQQACELLRAAGYCCTGDQHDGKMGFSFLVSRERVAWEDMANMYKAGPMGPAWKGRAWVFAMTPNIVIHTGPGDLTPRIWGKVLAFGDHELLDEIEQSTLRKVE